MHCTVVCVFCISFVFSNGHHVLSQCNTLLRLPYLYYDIDFIPGGYSNMEQTGILGYLLG